MTDAWIGRHPRWCRLMMIDFRRSVDRIPQEKVQATRGFLPSRQLNKSDWDLAVGCMGDRSPENGAFRLQGVLGRSASAAFSPSVRERPTFFFSFLFFSRLQRFPMTTRTVNGCFFWYAAESFSASVREQPTVIFLIHICVVFSKTMRTTYSSFSFTQLNRFLLNLHHYENGQRFFFFFFFFFFFLAESFSASLRE